MPPTPKVLGGIKQCCDPSVCLSHVRAQKRCVLGIWLWNTNRKPDASNRTHRSARPYDHQKWPKLSWKNTSSLRTKTCRWRHGYWLSVGRIMSYYSGRLRFYINMKDYRM